MHTTSLLADYQTRDELALELRVTPRTLDRWRAVKSGPPVTKLGKRVLYARAHVTEWLQKLKQA